MVTIQMMTMSSVLGHYNYEILNDRSLFYAKYRQVYVHIPALSKILVPKLKLRAVIYM